METSQDQSEASQEISVAIFQAAWGRLQGQWAVLQAVLVASPGTWSDQLVPLQVRLAALPETWAEMSLEKFSEEVRGLSLEMASVLQASQGPLGQ
jgi:hypothetical protein